MLFCTYEVIPAAARKHNSISNGRELHASVGLQRNVCCCRKLRSSCIHFSLFISLSSSLSLHIWLLCYHLLFFLSARCSYRVVLEFLPLRVGDFKALDYIRACPFGLLPYYFWPECALFPNLRRIPSSHLILGLRPTSSWPERAIFPSFRTYSEFTT